jgi:hypothetical protein
LGVSWTDSYFCHVSAGKADVLPGGLPVFSSLGEKDSGEVSRAMQDVNNVDALGLRGDTVENLVAAVNTMPHAAIFVARHEWVGEGHVCKAHALVMQLTNEAQGAAWIVAGDVVADGLKLSLGGRQDANNHALPFTIA